jgi:nucleotide-binding universal stress UspA family protein
MSSESKKILVPVGFSDQSFNALDQAAMFAKPIGAEVVLLSVVELNGLFKRMFSSEEKLSDFKKEVTVKLQVVADEFEERYKIKTTTMVANGVVYEEISRVAELLNVELVVMGTNGKPNNNKKKIIGSNAYRVVSSVEPPVVVVKGIDMRSEINTIIFPLVADRKSREKIGNALHYARLFDACIKVVAVSKSKDETPKLAASLKQVLKFVNDAKVECEGEIVFAEKRKVHEVIFDYRKEQKGDIVIITEDGDDFKIGLGTTDVERIIYGAEAPVMCITPTHTKFQNQFDAW